MKSETRIKCHGSELACKIAHNPNHQLYEKPLVKTPELKPEVSIPKKLSLWEKFINKIKNI